MEENKMSLDYWRNAFAKTLTIDDVIANEFVMTIAPELQDPKLKFGISKINEVSCLDDYGKQLVAYLVYDLKTITEKKPVDIYKLIVRFVGQHEPDVYLGFLYNPDLVLNRADLQDNQDAEFSCLIKEGKFTDVIALPEGDEQQFIAEQIFMQQAWRELHGKAIVKEVNNRNCHMLTTISEYEYSTTQLVKGIPPEDWIQEIPINDRIFLIELGTAEYGHGVIDMIQARKLDSLSQVWLDQF